MKTTRKFITAATLLAMAAPLLFTLPLTQAAGDKVQLMFVQTSDAVKTDAKTLRLVDVNRSTVWRGGSPIFNLGFLPFLAATPIRSPGCCAWPSRAS